MKFIPETTDDIVLIIANEFRSFGGGKGSTDNPIAAALKDTPAQFAAGVDIKKVVERILEIKKDMPDN